MARISAQALADVFRTMLGWPYVSPGSSNARGIDCSGAFVYAYRQFGQRIYHGSNRIIRRYCHDVFTIRSGSQLRVGMAIFKSRSDVSRMKAEYKPGGRYYDPALPNDYYHIGLVASVSPLQIINATPPAVRIDTDLSRWQCAGWLNAVDYENGGTDESIEGAESKSTATVVAESGSTVNLRSAPSLDAVIRVRVPLGRTVEVLGETNDEWANVRYETYTGYMMRAFLAPD